jgi:hypothetical protein
MVEDHGKELMALSPVDWHRDWEIELAPFSVQALALVNNDPMGERGSDLSRASLTFRCATARKCN